MSAFDDFCAGRTVFLLLPWGSNLPGECFSKLGEAQIEGTQQRRNDKPCVVVEITLKNQFATQDKWEKAGAIYNGPNSNRSQG